MSTPQAPGWRVETDRAGLLLRAPSGGALRVDQRVAAVFEDGEADGAGRLFSAVTREVLARLGALELDGLPEPARPPAPERGPLVSVIVTTYQARELVLECVRALQAQRYAPLEIVVVDGGSTDGTYEALRAEAPAAVVIEARGNPGFAAANNAGAQVAGGEHLLFLNNDAVLAEDAVGQLVRVAQARPRRLAAVCAMTRRADLPPVVESLGNVAGMRGYGAGRYAGFVDFGQFAGDGQLFSAAFTAVLVSRAAWRAVGPLDERYGYYYEDVDWSLRARMGGLELWPAPHALAFHRGSASFAGHPDVHKLRLVTRNRLLFAGKVLRLRNAVGFARRYAREDLRNMRGALAEGREDEARALLSAWLGAARQLPSLWQARKALERWHLVPDEVLFRAAAVAGPLMDGPYPLLQEPVIRGHYLHLASLRRRVRPRWPRTTSAPA